jgi:hypothetical protein
MGVATDGGAEGGMGKVEGPERGLALALHPP